MSMCNACFQEQNELLERTGGGCGQIICTHDVEEEETPQPPVKKRKRIQTKIVNDASTQTNNDNDDDDIFPTMEEMLQPNVIAFGKVPVKEPYQIMKVEEKTETFKGVTSEKLHMTLRRKGEENSCTMHRDNCKSFDRTRKLLQTMQRQ